MRICKKLGKVILDGNSIWDNSEMSPGKTISETLMALTVKTRRHLISRKLIRMN